MLRINLKLVVLMGSALLTGCASTKDHLIHAEPKSVLRGPQVTNNGTPLEKSFQCMENNIRQNGKIGLAVSVGNVKDYTGKFSESDGGNPITQGGSLMVSSALGKLAGVVKMRERFDTQVAEIELAYMNKQYLGDGGTHRINDPRSQQVKEVRWMPYRGGSILKSDYYIVGGITELNYNIQSAGAELAVAGYGLKRRAFVVNVAVDLRIVNTRSLTVEKSVSLQKQLVGYEVGASIFRFFGDRLVDFNAGSKRQEPLQLGVRTALEMGVLELIGHVTGVSPHECVESYVNPGKKDVAAEDQDNEQDQFTTVAPSEMSSDTAATVKAKSAMVSVAPQTAKHTAMDAPVAAKQMPVAAKQMPDKVAKQTPQNKIVALPLEKPAPVTNADSADSQALVVEPIERQNAVAPNNPIFAPLRPIGSSNSVAVGATKSTKRRDKQSFGLQLDGLSPQAANETSSGS